MTQYWAFVVAITASFKVWKNLAFCILNTCIVRCIDLAVLFPVNFWNSNLCPSLYLCNIDKDTRICLINWFKYMRLPLKINYNFISQFLLLVLKCSCIIIPFDLRVSKSSFLKVVLFEMFVLDLKWLYFCGILFCQNQLCPKTQPCQKILVKSPWNDVKINGT